MTHKDIILKELREAKGDWIPVTRFLQMFITRAAARINDLREEGYPIETRIVPGKRYAEYRLVEEVKQLELI